MNKTKIGFISLFILLISLFSSVFLFSQGARPMPVTVGQEMRDFTLPIYQGGEMTLSKLTGKNVMLIFPRGLAGEDHWCHICNYQYAELAELEKEKNIREKYNLDIYFILPYGKNMVDNWIEKFPDQLQDIENWKNPEEPEKLDERGKARMAMIKQAFPKKFLYEKGEVPTSIPILVDAEAKVSKNLGLFTTEWGGSKIEQNVPAIFIIDKKGTVQFKYHSQNTFDRPGFDYLMKFMDKMIMN